MGERRAFTRGEIREIKQYRKQGLSYRDIGVLMDRTMRSIQHVFDKDARPNPRPVHFDAVNRMRVPAEVWDDRQRRAMLEPKDTTARLQGDPLPGMSALERGK
jgi:hypothetical protein